MFSMERWSVPPVMMLVCLLLMFNEKVPRTCDVQFVELFAGVAQISQNCALQGMVGSAHDIEYSSHFDLCGRTGFLNHGVVVQLLNCFLHSCDTKKSPI